MVNWENIPIWFQVLSLLAGTLVCMAVFCTAIGLTISKLLNVAHRVAYRRDWQMTMTRRIESLERCSSAHHMRLEMLEGYSTSPSSAPPKQKSK